MMRLHACLLHMGQGTHPGSGITETPVSRNITEASETIAYYLDREDKKD